MIDEYDTPIHAGYFEGYYKNVVNFMREFLGAGLKDNPNIEKAVITGILRIAKESIFSGLNNLSVYSFLRPEFSDHFGFSVAELKEILKYYDLEEKFEQINTWYNGYIFGDKVVFNAWPIINYVKSKDKLFRPYWSNTSSNDLIQKLITEGGDEIKYDIEKLIEEKKLASPLLRTLCFQNWKKETMLSGAFYYLLAIFKSAKCTTGTGESLL